MEVNRTALWILIVVASVAGLVYAVASGVRREYYAMHRTWREAPLRLVRTCADSALTGVGMGLAAATLTLFAAAIIARVTPFH